MRRIFALLIICLLWQVAAQAQTKEEKRVAAAVESFRTVLVNPDKVVLENLLSEELSFGHSSGKVEGKTTVIDKLVSGNTNWVTVEFKNQTVQLNQNTAVVRHTYVGQLQSTDTLEIINMHVLLIWQKHRGSWQLLARQATKI
ncbi:nuclear transport factor 2 family protein [Pontibacter qinzhouensis]|uniref:Nuclear transport factor 2 family protein n=1 Tax=Pontibacter qinzhouensis TaxID=2603253 RepID=A0A5C8K9H6_9BACT|nr:nuclear transport factor 2 family protein [Pontibacter qinzhouensis]TXK48065.1 nuclear transport factor 2 family protein [Pontibacter qinzhouensis]